MVRLSLRPVAGYDSHEGVRMVKGCLRDYSMFVGNASTQINFVYNVDIGTRSP